MGKRHSTWVTGADDGAAGDLDDPPELPIESPGRYVAPDGPDELGRGGIGRVVVTTDRHLGREVARKELLPGAKASHVARFLREARVTAGLEHPNVVPVHEIGLTPEGRMYYTMKRVRGRTLRDALGEARDLDGRLALLPHFVDVCQAIAYAHSLGVVHRDLKPDNVMVGEFGETVVLDWGLAKVRGQEDLREEDMARKLDPFASGDGLMTMQGTTLGTPAYMSPEAARGEIDRVDERSDVWSLGAVLYEVLTGRPPFEGETLDSILSRVRKGDFPPIRDADGAPPALRAIVGRALQADPAKRYATAKELAADVAAFMNGERVGAYAYSLREEIGRVASRYRGVIGTAAVAALALAAFAAISVQSIARERDRAVGAEAALAIEKANTEAELARALTGAAADRMLSRDGASAAVLAARVLDMGESPDARGLYVAGTSLAPPRLTWTAPLRDSCDALRYSPDGKWLACSTVKGVHLWTVADRQGKVVPEKDDYGWGFAWSPDSSVFALGGETAVRIVDPDDGRVVRRVENEVIALSVAWLPDGGLAVGGEDGIIRLYAADGAPRGRLEKHAAWIFALALSPDGRTLASGGSDHTIRLWDLARLRERPPLAEHGHGGSGLVWLSDDRLASIDWVGDDDRVWIWDLRTGQPRVIEGANAEMSAIAAAPGGEWLAAVSASGSVRVYGDESVLLATLPDGEPGLHALAASPTGGALFVSNDRELQEWTMPLGPASDRLTGHVRQVSGVLFEGPRQALSAGEDGDLVRWDLPSARPIARRHLEAEGLWGLASDGDTVWVGARRGSVHALDATTLETRWTAAVGTGVTDLVPSPTGGVFVVDWDHVTALNPDGTIRAQRAVHEKPALTSIALAGDQLVVTTREEAALVVVDPASLEAVETLKVPVEGGLGDVAVSPDGRWVAAVDDRGGVWVWDWATRQRTGPLPAHDEQQVTVAAFSPDGAWLVTGGEDGFLEVRAVGSWDLLARIPAHGTRAVWSVAFDGPTKALSAGADGVVRRWFLAGMGVPAGEAVARTREELGLTCVGSTVAADPERQGQGFAAANASKLP